MMQRPIARLAVVLLLGTCLWATTGRRERVAEHSVNGVQDDGRIGEREIEKVARPRIAVATRRLPPRVMDRTVATDDHAVRADFETGKSNADGAVHAAGFSAEVTANAPAWLTGTIEFE